MAIYELQQAKRSLSAPDHFLPPLNNGDHLTLAEFERRYEARPDIKKAELIEGVVYVASPVSLLHAEIHANIMTVLSYYRAHTPGIRFADNVSLVLDADNEVQPDVCLWRDREAMRPTAKNYLSGVPELVVEVAVSSAAYDLYEKKHVYRRNGVQEYLLLLAQEREMQWLALREGSYVALEADAAGVIRSQVFPGSALSPALFWANEFAQLLTLLQAEMATPAYVAFRQQL